jgi:hypothetical protein
MTFYTNALLKTRRGPVSGRYMLEMCNSLFRGSEINMNLDKNILDPGATTTARWHGCPDAVLYESPCVPLRICSL